MTRDRLCRAVVGRIRLAPAVALVLLCFPISAHATLTWSGPVNVLPFGKSLFGVACWSASQCTVAGEDGEEYTFDPSSPGTPTPAPVAVDGSDTISAVACPQQSQCVGVDTAGFSVTFDPTSPTSPAPSYTPLGVAAAYGVACPSPSECVAVGSSGHEVTFDPGTHAASSYAVDGTTSNQLAGVACTSITLCTAVDYGGYEVTFNPQSPSTGPPTPVSIDPGNDLYAVVCPSSAQCTAVDDDAHQVTFDPPAPGAATITPTPTPVTIDNDFQSIYGIACPSTTDCIAVDRGAVPSHALEGDPGSSGSWSIEPMSVAAGNYLYGIACTSSAQCVAVDALGNIYVGTGGGGGGGGSPGAPSNTAPPSISGKLSVRQRLSASSGTWSGTAPLTYSYQWQRCMPACANIAGATGPVYTIGSSDVGANLRVLVTAGNSAGSIAAASAEVGPVVGPPTSSGGSFSGVAARKAKLVFTVLAGKHAPSIKTITVSLPKGLGFVSSTRTLTGALTIKGPRAKKLRFTAKRHAGAVTLTLKSAASTVQVRISSSAFAIAQRFAKSVKDGKVKLLTVLLTVTDTAHTTTKLSLKLGP